MKEVKLGERQKNPRHRQGASSPCSRGMGEQRQNPPLSGTFLSISQHAAIDLIEDGGFCGQQKMKPAKFMLQSNVNSDNI
jgi:hypothetical protein